ncbi:DNA-formamidopyrimidine glycosylase [Ureaplasma sp. ES3154-GEN]|uniref:DNA-formamidopyrimidine glycosylase n=1 Tax=Ureaplasma sp. ES3154-GEN TaxID=2984844 RepID=UPI0021E75CE2|nr:DNA-formamidopyrimidine glycosylase [Ureaplasma sp. ES3154-GEN]MCV3743857.1 DNA-formamidopyrimidine glycosylase [Ureaplasma sp. ES3154-GEN]
MPELPEVQVIVNHLNSQVCAKNINHIDVHLPKIIKNLKPIDFVQMFTNTFIREIKRVGKYLLFMMSNDYVLQVHLRMEGRFYYVNEDEFINRAHSHIIFHLDNQKRLIYYDTRQFGTFHVYHRDDLVSSKELKKVNKDPLDPEVDGQYFYDQLHHLKKDIKTTLLDQQRISGIGNIYANEILFAAKIHPIVQCTQLTLFDYQNIYQHAKRILRDSIDHDGTSIHTFQIDQDRVGSYQNCLQIHGRDKQLCYQCNNPVKKIKLNGRGTYFCEHCQKSKD